MLFETSRRNPGRDSRSHVVKILDLASSMPLNGVLDSESYTRYDGRYPEQLRPIHITLSPLSKAVSSAFVDFDKGPHLVISISPPRLCSRSRVFKPLGVVECRLRAVHTGEIDSGEQEEMSRIVSDTLMSFVCRKTFPNSFITIDVLVLRGSLKDDREAILSGAINGAGVALAGAGIDILAVPVAVPFALYNSSALILDHTPEERRWLRKDLLNSPVGVAVAAVRGGAAIEVAHIDIQGSFSDHVLLSESLKQLLEDAFSMYESAIRPVLVEIK